MMQQIGRAVADEVREEGGVRVHYVRDLAQAEKMHAEMQAAFARDVSLTAATAQAVSFTCRPCGRTLPLEEGAYNPANRVLCETCFAADAERRRNARRSGTSEWKFYAAIIAGLVGVALYYYIRYFR